MIDTDVEQWLRQPVKTSNMINLSIDEETKTVQFKGPVNFEKAQVVMQCLIDGFGWSRQDAKMDVVGCGPTVVPGMPVPVAPGYISNCTPIPCGHCEEVRLAANAPLWQTDPRV